MPKSFFTGTVVAPVFFTLASTEQATVTSKSVAVNSTRSFSARNRTLERIGSVVRAADNVLNGLQPGENLLLRDGQIHVVNNIFIWLRNS